MPNKDNRYANPVTSASFGVIVKNGTTLVGFDKDGRTAAPGGKREPIDNFDPDKTFMREKTQEVGSRIKLRQLSQPLVFCTCPVRKYAVQNPQPGQDVDLRFFYLFEAINDADPEECEPNEMKTPFFALPSHFKDLQAGKTIRNAFFHALVQFAEVDLWPLQPEDMPTVKTDHNLIGDHLTRLNFGPRFVKSHTKHARHPAHLLGGNLKIDKTPARSFA